MVLPYKRRLLVLLVSFLIIDIGLFIWLRAISFSLKSEKAQLGNKKEKQRQEKVFMDSFNDEGKTNIILPGYFKKNPVSGAIAVGILETVAKKGDEVVANFRFGEGDGALKIGFVVGLIKPKTKLHFYRSKSRELTPFSSDTSYQQIEPEQVVSVLQPYIGKPFRLSLKEPYNEEEILQQGVKKEVYELIKTLNPYFQCNKLLIEVNKEGILSQAVKCQGAVFDLLTYDPNW